MDGKTGAEELIARCSRTTALLKSLAAAQKPPTRLTPAAPQPDVSDHHRPQENHHG